VNQLAGISTRDDDSVFARPSVKTKHLFRSPVPAPHAFILKPFGVDHLEPFRQHFQQHGRDAIQSQGTIDGDLQFPIFSF